MRHIKEIYPLVKQVRQRVIETMQERGISEVQFIPSEDEWLEQNPDKYDDDYYVRRDEVCPNVVYFDKYGCGYEYQVTKVLLIGKDPLGFPLFKLECEANELGYDTFLDTDVYDMTWVYEMLEKHLGLDNEPEKIWIVKQESNDDGEMHFFTQPCKDESTAKIVLHEWKEALLTKHPKYCDAKPYIDGEKDPDDQVCCYEWEDHDAGFYIKVLDDEYYENITIEEEKIR